MSRELVVSAMSDQSLSAAFLGALQASVSVLLTMTYGIVTRECRLLSQLTINEMIALGVKLFLPALTLVKLGSELRPENVMNYLPVLVWALLYTVVSVAMGFGVTKLLRLPDWVITACAFNNTTSLPLLLLQSLQNVGSLRLVVPGDKSVSDAINRAQSYFLVFAVFTKSAAYVIAPRLLYDGGENEYQQQQGQQIEDDTEAPQQLSEEQIHEETSLLPGRVRKIQTGIQGRLRRSSQFVGSFFPKDVRDELLAPFEHGFTNLAVFSAILGAVLGLVPQLHRAFFATPGQGGIFTAWLTSSIMNVGQLFTTIQVFLVGGKLAISFERMKQSVRGSGGRVPIRAVVAIFLVRMVIWPALSISAIYVLASKTKLIGEEPILWFSMMLMPSGPPALVLAGLAELARASEMEQMVIAKTLTTMYILSPSICFTITGALRASQAAMHARNIL